MRMPPTENPAMIYMHYCANCHYIHMLNGHKPFCPTCGLPLKELDISYLDYCDLNRSDRERLLLSLAKSGDLKNTPRTGLT
ncbi:MAG: hypothetical protein LUI10_03045 [Lachnospiraceae bacterium]|nr:hypothetical protein [Lachnospiraceae bacterium]